MTKDNSIFEHAQAAAQDLKHIEAEINAFARLAVGTESEYYFIANERQNEADLALQAAKNRAGVIEKLQRVLSEVGIPSADLPSAVEEILDLRIFEAQRERGSLVVSNLCRLYVHFMKDGLWPYIQAIRQHLASDGSPEARAFQRLTETGSLLTGLLVPLEENAMAEALLSQGLNQLMDQVIEGGTFRLDGKALFYLDKIVGFSAAPEPGRIHAWAGAALAEGNSEKYLLWAADQFARLSPEIFAANNKGADFEARKAQELEDMRILAHSSLAFDLLNGFAEYADHYFIEQIEFMQYLLGELHETVKQFQENSLIGNINRVFGRYPEITSRAGDDLRTKLFDAIEGMQRLKGDLGQDMATEQLKQELEQRAIPLHATHFEIGVGVRIGDDAIKLDRQFEVVLSHEHADKSLVTAEQSARYLAEARSAMLRCAEQAGISLSFDPMPTPQHASNGIHLHFDLRRHDDPAHSLFADLLPSRPKYQQPEDTPFQPNPIMDYVERGVLALINEGIFLLAPSQQAMDRFRLGKHVAKRINVLGFDNRASALRRVEAEGQVHLEVRLASSDADPHALHALTAAGILHGLHHYALDTQCPVPISPIFKQWAQEQRPIERAALMEASARFIDEAGRALRDHEALLLPDLGPAMRRTGLNAPEKFIQSWGEQKAGETLNQEELQHILSTYRDYTLRYLQSLPTDLPWHDLGSAIRAGGFDLPDVTLGALSRGELRVGSLLQFDPAEGFALPLTLEEGRMRLASSPTIKIYLPNMMA